MGVRGRFRDGREARRMNGLASFVTPLDWAVLGAYLAAVTLLAWRAGGKPAGPTDFFLAGRSLPWPLAAASVVATELGVVAFLVVPAAMLDWQGDGARLQWAIGAVVARIVVAFVFVKRCWDGESETPYDWIGRRIGPQAKGTASCLFVLGGLLAHSARLLLGAGALALVTPLSPGWSVLLVAGFGVLWAIPGGIRSAAWSHAANLLVVAAAGAAALWWTLAGFESGWATWLETIRGAEDFAGVAADKLRVFDFRIEAGLEFTFWSALFAAPFLHASVLAADHSCAQALLSCRGPVEARKAVLWSSLGQFAVLLMVLLGASLFVFYRIAPPTDPLVLKALRWSGGEPEAPALALPVWVVTEMPQLCRGLLLAGIFAATSSGFVSFVVALSHLAQLARGRRSAAAARAGSASRVRFEVLRHGLLAGGFALCLGMAMERFGTGPLPLLERIPTYTAGPLLAILLLALAGRARAGGLVVGTALSMLAVALSNRDWMLLEGDGLVGSAFVRIHAALSSGPATIVGALFAAPWAVAVATLVTMGCGWDFRRRTRSDF